MRSVRHVLAVLGVSGLLVGCGSSTKASSPTASKGPGVSNGPNADSAATGSTDHVTIKSFAFHPSALEARVGQTITITNGDDTTHTFTAVDKSFDTANLAAGASGKVSLTKSGTITYHCSIHNFMTGVIHVSA